MKVLVTGADGQLGYDVCRVLAARGMEYLGVDLAEFDITDAAAVHGWLTEYRPDVVIHCSAWTAVDEAEFHRERVYAVNVEGTRNIALSCKEIGAKMMLISTDYVFGGTGERFYQPDDPKDPVNYYGASKLAAEQAVQELLSRYFIVRISWAFGIRGKNFVQTMLRLAEEKSAVNVVCDQIGSPTYTFDLAPLLCDMVATERYGMYHATNEGICSWAAFAREIFRMAGKNVIVNPVTTAQYPTPAARPLNSRLSKEKLEEQGFSRLPTWQSALERYLQEIKEVSAD